MRETTFSVLFFSLVSHHQKVSNKRN